MRYRNRGRNIRTIALALLILGSAACTERKQQLAPVGEGRAGLTVPGLVAAYGFNEGSGAATGDATGNGHDAALSGQSWVTGRYGGALSFDTNFLTVADSALLDLSTGLTLSAWIKPLAHHASWPTIALKERPDDLSYALYAGWNGSAEAAALCLGTVEQLGDCASGGATSVDTWSHIAGTFDGSFERLYVNGELVSSQPSTTPLVASENPLRIGGNSIWGEYFTGIIDELRVYDRALTAGEVVADIHTPVDDSQADTTAPVAVITSPANTARVAGPVTVLVNATDNVSVAAVKFFVDGNLLTEDTWPPFEAVWDSTSAPPGAHVLSVEARDGSGNTGTSAVNVTVVPGALVAVKIPRFRGQHDYATC